MLLFAPISVGAFLLACRWRPSAAVPTLLATAAAFCWLADPGALIYLTVSLVGNFATVTVLRRLADRPRAQRAITAAAIVTNLLPLFVFRWQAASVAGAAHGSLVPLGYAFYTLGQISFLLDAQRAGAATLSFPRYAAGLSLFCQLPAGPVISWRGMEAQYQRLGRFVPSRWTVARGGTLFLAGLGKKTWIADPLADMVDALWRAAQAGPVAPLEAWLVAWGFLLQLYFDFSSYSDMAIGIALCLGLVLPINFNSPLKARSPGDYVMRWHVSLMMFLRLYVFEPAFRAARRLPIRPTPRRYAVAYALATLAALMAVGAWHSISPTTLIVAALLGMLLVAVQLARSASRDGTRPVGRLRRRAAAIGGRVFVLIAASILALFLRADDAGVPLQVIGTMFDGGGAAAQVADFLRYGVALFGDAPVAVPDPLPASGFPAAVAAQLVLPITLVALAAPNTMELFGMIEPAGRVAARWRWRPSLGWGLATGALLMLALVGIASPASQHEFIYARI